MNTVPPCPRCACTETTAAANRPLRTLPVVEDLVRLQHHLLRCTCAFNTVFVTALLETPSAPHATREALQTVVRHLERTLAHVRTAQERLASPAATKPAAEPDPLAHDWQALRREAAKNEPCDRTGERSAFIGTLHESLTPETLSALQRSAPDHGARIELDPVDNAVVAVFAPDGTDP